MQYRIDDKTIYLRVDKGEEVLSTLAEFCASHGVLGAAFTGIGACSRVMVATWIPERADFVDHVYEGTIEMVSLTGNVTRDRDGRPRFHAHGVFSRLGKDGEPEVFAGHLKEVVVGYTAELTLAVSSRPIDITFDEAAGIDVWDLGR